jgi:23S rRNA pseudouridine1911/1915/1917 synthase
METYLISPELAGTRLDQAVPLLQPGLSRAYGQQLIAEGQIQVNGRPAKASARLKAGDTVTVAIPPPAPVAIAPEAIPLTVVY